MRTRRALALYVVLAGAQTLKPQNARTLSLEEAEKTALKNHPRIGSAEYSAEAAKAVINEVKANFYPVLSGNVTTAGADPGTVIGAGMLQTSSLSSRAATGIAMNQLITDFGRTSNLVGSARLRAAAQERIVSANRADILLRVDRAFFSTLAAEAVLKVAQATLDARRLTLRQVSALAESSLKSTLDVSFAEVAVSEAELALYQAENNARSSHAILSASMGYRSDESYSLADVTTLPSLSPDVEGLVTEALNARPDLAAVRLNQSAAERFAHAEKRLTWPSVNFVGVTGVMPLHQEQFTSNYGGAGVNISIPFLNGGLFAARRAEAELRAQAVEKDAQDLALQVASAVRVSWLEANNSFRKLDVTARLVEQASQTLRLANTRYEIGLGGILEVTQAQLAQTSAQIAAVNARYNYLSRMSTLEFATGALR